LEELASPPVFYPEEPRVLKMAIYKRREIGRNEGAE
jgi:hypothetical protein